MTERTFTATEMREWADQFEPPPLVSMSIGVRDCRNTAAMLRQGADAIAALTAAAERETKLREENERLKAERDDLHAAIWEREKPHADVLSLAKAHRSDSESVDAYEASKEAAESALAAERQKVQAIRKMVSEKWSGCRQIPSEQARQREVAYEGIMACIDAIVEEPNR